MKMTMKKTLISAFILTMIPLVSMAQEKVEGEISADFVSQYVWRGLDLGKVSIQPTLGVSYKGLSLSAWGSVGVTDSNDPKEFDLTASYTIGGLSFGVTDYWFNSPEPQYFVYASHKTSHLFEGFVGYDFNVLSLSWYTNFAGNDGVNKSGKRAYSSYVEAAVPFTLGGLDWKAVLGIVPYATTAYETDAFSVTNISLNASKDIEITEKFTLPVFAGVMANPYSKKAYFFCGFTLKP